MLKRRYPEEEYIEPEKFFNPIEPMDRSQTLSALARLQLSLRDYIFDDSEEPYFHRKLDEGIDEMLACCSHCGSEILFPIGMYFSHNFNKMEEIAEACRKLNYDTKIEYYCENCIEERPDMRREALFRIKIEGNQYVSRTWIDYYNIRPYEITYEFLRGAHTVNDLADKIPNGHRVKEPAYYFYCIASILVPNSLSLSAPYLHLDNGKYFNFESENYTYLLRKGKIDPLID